MAFNKKEMMQKVRELKEKMDSMQTSLEDLRIKGESGAGMVKVTMNGKYHAVKLELNNDALDESKEVLQDLLVSAINNATEKVFNTLEGKFHTMGEEVGLDTRDLLGSESSSE